MKKVFILSLSILISVICFIFFGCTKSHECNCVAKSPNQSDVKHIIKDPSKEEAKKTCDTFEHDATNNLEYDCTLK